MCLLNIINWLIHSISVANYYAWEFIYLYQIVKVLLFIRDVKASLSDEKLFSAEQSKGKNTYNFKNSTQKF